VCIVLGRVGLIRYRVPFGDGRIPPWHADALCVEYAEHARWWFPEDGESNSAAKSICRRCLVREQCLDDALARPASDDEGVLGGLSPKERAQARLFGMSAAEVLAGE
jgi:WhiB family transcriptional regulator, redox-sensing transcriptional regulator